MTAKEIAKRNKKAEQLKVLQTDDGQFYVESGEGKILYNVVLGDEKNTCTCGDFARNTKKDPNFTCKHILSVINAIPTGNVENGMFLEKLVPKLDDRFLTNIKGKDFVLYAGLLDLATQKGLMELEVELLQFPNKENGNEAICRAVAVSKNGHSFSDIGDANKNNCAPMIAKHLIRMASTRAKGRALRDMCNIGMTCLEEIGSLDDVIGSETPKRTTRKKTAPKKTAKPAAAKKTPAAKKSPPKTKKADPPPEKPEIKNTGNKTDAPLMSEAQKRAIFNLSRRRGISVEELESMAVEAYGTELENLCSSDASTFIRNLQQAA